MDVKEYTKRSLESAKGREFEDRRASMRENA